MYSKISCINYFSGIDKPMIFINAVDDPIVPPQLLEKIKDVTSEFFIALASVSLDGLIRMAPKFLKKSPNIK